MNLLAHMRIFSLVAQSGSLDVAMRELDLTAAVIKRSLARLEKHLNCALLTCSDDALLLTDAGQTFFKRCAPAVAAADEAVNAVIDGNLEPEGHLRLHAGGDLGNRYLIGLIARYRSAHPQVTFDVTLDHHNADVAGGEFDMAISQTRPGDSRLLVRNIGATYNVLCAAPDYLARHGAPRVPEELARYQCLSPLEEPANPDDIWAFHGPYGPVNVYVPAAAVQFNSQLAMVEAARAGLGIGSIPAYVASPELNAGRLVRVLPGYHLQTCGVHASYRRSAQADVCLRSWLAFLAVELPRSMAAGLEALSEPARWAFDAAHELA